jgi:hypothetical protein
MPRFAKKERGIVNARQLDEAVLVLAADGETLAEVGDWIVEDNGQLRVCKQDEFGAMFEALDSANPFAEVSQ